MSSVRGVILMKSIQNYLKTKPSQFDTSAVFSKVRKWCIKTKQTMFVWEYENTVLKYFF